MRAEPIKSRTAFHRHIELVAGVTTALIALGLWTYMVAKDLSLRARLDARSVVFTFLMLVVPGVAVAVGVYLHVTLRKSWAAILVFLGAFLNILFVGVNAGIVFFGLTTDNIGRLMIFLDFAFAIITIAGAGISVVKSTAPTHNR